MTDYTYDVFISHSSKDIEFVRLLDKKLRAVGIRTFFSERDIPWGGNIPSTIASAIGASGSLIVVLSPDAVGSEWDEMELSIGCFRSPGARDAFILPILLRDCDIPGILSFRKYISARNAEELQVAWPAILDHLQRLHPRSTGGTQRHAAFGVVCPLFGASKAYYTELLSSISAKANDLGYPILIAPIADLKYKRTLIAHFPQLLSVAGVILITCQVERSTWLEECASHNLPVVLVHDSIPEDRVRPYSVISCIRPELAGLRDLVFFLVDRQSRKNMSIVLVDPEGHAIRTEKLDAIQMALGARGLALDRTPERQVFYVPDYSYSAGYAVTDRILEKNPNTDAIVCLADVTAVAVVHRLKALGKAGSISVTGFDNIDVAEYNSIATVDQQLGHTGRTAVFDLYKAVSAERLPPLALIPVSWRISTTFVPRESA